MIVVDGAVVGIWKRAVRKGHLTIEPEWFIPPTPKEAAAFEETVGRYAAFLGLPFQRLCS
jgi:hypothetical protein